MTNIPDSGRVGRMYCPGCEPEADSSLEVLEALYCANHNPYYGGEDDASVMARSSLSGGAEAGGETNRRLCDLIHRDLPKKKR